MGFWSWLFHLIKDVVVMHHKPYFPLHYFNLLLVVAIKQPRMRPIIVDVIVISWNHVKVFVVVLICKLFLLFQIHPHISSRHYAIQVFEVLRFKIETNSSKACRVYIYYTSIWFRKLIAPLCNSHFGDYAYITRAALNLYNHICSFEKLYE